MTTAVLRSFVTGKAAEGHWRRPFLRRNGPKPRHAAGGRGRGRRPRRSQARCWRRLAKWAHAKPSSRCSSSILIISAYMYMYTYVSFAAGGAHAPLCLLNFLGSSRTSGVVSRLAYKPRLRRALPGGTVEHFGELPPRGSLFVCREFQHTATQFLPK